MHLEVVFPVFVDQQVAWIGNQECLRKLQEPNFGNGQKPCADGCPITEMGWTMDRWVKPIAIVTDGTCRSKKDQKGL